MRPAGGRWLAAALALATSCGGVGLVRERSPHTPAPPRCEAGFEAPAGFRPTQTLEERYGDHIGVRLGFRDGDRELRVFAGIPGEFGEGLPLAGEIALLSGDAGRLLGQGEVWVLAWDTSGPCAAHAVFGSGLSRDDFLEVLGSSGVVAAQD